ncbi:MAG TPA: iron-sulfur cluster assembly scaffold protein [Terriglobales bacterium]|nr:iron-sulfur cluster assembly scaffold protein [Terriglobales bacterium]
MYSPQVLDHFEHPRNVGEVEQADATAEVENPACGDVMRLSVKLREGRVAQARFRTKGCVTAIACGSRLTEWLSGRSLAEARSLRREQLVESLGGLSPETLHASHLAMEALAAVLQKLHP